MKNSLLIIFILIFSQITGLSQPCLPDGIEFNTQAEIDNFQTNYPNCTEIEGDVVIKGYWEDLTNLNGLSVLTFIGGSLEIGFLHTWSNPSLTSLSGLENVTFIGGDLRFFRNPALTNLTGLDNLTSIGGNLWIACNPILTSLTGLDSVTSIGGDINITGNYDLNSLSGLENLTSVEGSLLIGGFMYYCNFNGYLTSLSGLDNVNSIGGNLEISINSSLTSLSGLENVSSIGGSLLIGNNALTSLSGLDNIDANSITNLVITGNTSLSTCEVQSICEYLVSPGGAIEIHNNATGCNSQEEVEEACVWIGVPDINFESEFSIFPNPAKDILTISCKGGSKIEDIVIYDQIGQKVLAGLLLDNTIDVSSLPPGLYFIHVQVCDQIATMKVVKIK